MAEITQAQVEDAKARTLARMRGDAQGYVPPIFLDGPKRKVCIVGFAGSSRDLYPKNDPDMEVWGMNRLHEVPGVDLKPFTRWFQIHTRAWWDTPKRQKEVAWMRSAPMPIYLHDAYPDMPSSIAYPKAAVETQYNRFLPELPEGGLRNDGLSYHTNSVSWMIALALLEGFEEIHIYGVDMVTDEEYGYQRPCCEFWLGLAAGLGVKTVIPAFSALCTIDWLYGYENAADLEGTITQPMVKALLDKAAKERDQAVAAVNQHLGAQRILEHFQATLKHRHRGGKTALIAASVLSGKEPEALIRKPAPASQLRMAPVHTEEPALKG